MKKIVILPAALAMALSGHPQVNSPNPEGFVTRGELMYRDNNYTGAIDQLTSPETGLASPDDIEAAAYTAALAYLKSGSIEEARRELVKFVDEYPASRFRLEAKMGIADCDFFDGNYKKALAGYRKIDKGGLNLAAQEDYDYRTAYCLMMLDDYDKALAGFRRLQGVDRYAGASRFYQGYIYYAQGAYAEAKKYFTEADTHTAPGNRAPYYLTQIAYIDHDYDKALALAKAHINDIPEYRSEMQRIAGESLYNRGDEEGALPYIAEYTGDVTNPKPSAMYILGVCQYKDSDYEAAIHTLQPVTACDDAMGQSAYLYIGQSYLQTGNVNGALLALEKAYRMDYDREVQETAFYNYAVAKAEGGRTPFGSSVSMFEDFLKRYPESRYAPEVEEYLVTGYMTDNNYEQALASIQKIRRPSAKILTAKQRVLYTLGTRDVAAGRISQAITRFTEAKSLAAHNKAIATECDLWLGDCYYRQGEYARAARAYNDYLKSSRANDANRQLAYYDLGYAEFAQKRYNDAAADFARVVKNPGNLEQSLVADAYNRLGDCRYYQSDFTAASTYYDQAYSLNPEAGDYALFQKAMMKGLVKNHHGKIESLDDMMERYPTSGLLPAAMLEKAESYVALNRPGDAVVIYESLVKRYPTTAQGRNGYLQLAITQLAQGKTDRAIESYKTVIRNYPTSEEARVASDDLKRLMADEGRLSEFSSFIAAVPNAPKFETSELDALTFQAAERAYLNDKSKTTRLKDYIAQYPGGRYETQALTYLSQSALESGNPTEALKYATQLTERYPDSEAAEDALAIKGNVEYDLGNGEAALATFRKLESRASASRNIVTARLGIMRVSRDMNRHSDVIEMADRLLKSTAIGTAQKNEIIYSRAYALSQTGKADEAVKEWEKLAKNTDDIYGAKSAYYLAQHYFDTGSTKKAKTTVEKLIDSNTPHDYWLARGYILLSDICRKQGSDFEATEYLKSLRDNYPGKEKDIFMMIDERLK